MSRNTFRRSVAALLVGAISLSTAAMADNFYFRKRGVIAESGQPSNPGNPTNPGQPVEVPLAIGTFESALVQLGNSVEATVAVNGGKTPYFFDVSEGSLPPGLALNAGTGSISGSPSAVGAYSANVRVTDAKGASLASVYEATVYAPLTMPGLYASAGRVGSSYLNNAVLASGGIAPYSYGVNGNIPQGLELNSATALLSGIPTAAGNFSFDITVTDSIGNTLTSAGQSISVAEPLPLAVAVTGANSAMVGTAYSANVSATTVNGSATYSIASGSLPGGVNLNRSTGAISGTPTAVGTFNAKFTVVDSIGATGTTPNNFTITVAPLTLTKTLASSTNVTIKSLFTGAEWSSTTPKVVVVPAGVIIGSTSPSLPALQTGTGAFGGALSLQINNGGEIQGKSGADVGGDAILVSLSGLSIMNNGAIRAAGGAGGKGGTGGAVLTAAPWEEKPITPSNGYKPNVGAVKTMVYYTGGVMYYYWNSVDPIATRPQAGANANNGVEVNGFYYTDQGYFAGDGTGAYGPIRRYQVNGASVGGGVGGAGGVGQGYLTSSSAGAAGLAGTNGGGTGGAGGAGGGWGAQGASGSTGGTAPVNQGQVGTAGVAGSLPGYAINGAAQATISGTGTRQGR
jgi:hypothetical protein